MTIFGGVSDYHNYILFKMFGLVCHNTFCANASTLTKTKLYISLIHSQIMYCSILWHPHSMQDFTKIEDYSVEPQATKYILNDFLLTINHV